jgi:hypothetical protein
VTTHAEPPPAETVAPEPTPAPRPARWRPTTSMILGIISIPAALFAILGVILGVVAIVLGATARGDIQRRGLTNSGQAMAGLICGSIGLVLGLANMIAGVIAATS